MSFCVVFKCKNRNNKKNEEQLEIERILNRKFSFHLFPRNIERRDKWLKALNLENYEPLKSAAVCSAHFKDTDYEINSNIRKLKTDAVPHLIKEESAMIDQVDLDYQIQSTIIDSKRHHQNITSIEENIRDKADKNNEVKVEACFIENNIMDTFPHNNTRMVHRSTSISPDRIINSSIKTEIRTVYTHEIKVLKRKLAIQRYQHKKTQEKVFKLKSMLKDLHKRNLLTTENSDILQYLNTDTKEL